MCELERNTRGILGSMLFNVLPILCVCFVCYLLLVDTCNLRPAEKGREKKKKKKPWY
jgi:hypothetical protein